MPKPAKHPPDHPYPLAVPAWPNAGRALGLGRNGTYAAIKDGSLPARKVGGRWIVSTVALLRLLGLDGEQEVAK